MGNIILAKSVICDQRKNPDKQVLLVLALNSIIIKIHIRSKVCWNLC